MSRNGVTPANLTVDQATAFEVTALVWRTGGGLGALSHPGHMSLVLRRQWDQGPWRDTNDRIVPAPDPTEYRYISFWPGGPSDKGTKLNRENHKTVYTSRRDATFLPHHLTDFGAELGDGGRAALDGGGPPRAGQVVIGTDNLDDVWGQRYQAFAHLPALCPARPAAIGLSLNRMIDWAHQFKASGEFNYTYISTSNNCSGVAVRGLVAGGADAFGPLGGNPSKGTLYFTPNDALVYVRGIARGIAEANRILTDLNVRSATTPLVGVDLMAADAFVRASKVDWKLRTPKLRKIDSALESYHRRTWAAAFPEKLDRLLTIIVNTQAYLAETTTHSRDAALLTLARQVRHVVATLAADAGQAWSPLDYYGDAHRRPAK